MMLYEVQRISAVCWRVATYFALKVLRSNLRFDLTLPLTKACARAQVGAAIQECKDAGIRVIMITGDNKLTAEAVARDIGIFDANTDVAAKSITGVPDVSVPDWNLIPMPTILKCAQSQDLVLEMYYYERSPISINMNEAP